MVMSRLFRLDWDGAINHVMARGVAKCEIFLDFPDRDRFAERLRKYSLETGVRVYAWVLMPNHIHMITETGSTPLSKLMHKLLGDHAKFFNMKHDRVGHLFQNRFHSVLVESEHYMMRLVRYIHLNPVKAGIVPSLDDLDTYRWSSHPDLVTPSRATWWTKQKVLELFGHSQAAGVRKYRSYLASDMTSEVEDLETGTFRIGPRGLETVSPHAVGVTTGINHRILGSKAFATQVLDRVRQHRGAGIRSRGTEHEMVRMIIEMALTHWSITLQQLTAGRRTKHLAEARSFVASCLIDQLGLSLGDAGGILHQSRQGVTSAARRFRLSIESGDSDSIELLASISESFNRVS